MSNMFPDSVFVKMKKFHDQSIQELIAKSEYDPVQKDILIVTCGQLEYVKKCIESVIKNTSDFSLYVWDNGGCADTHAYLKNLAKENKISLYSSSFNIGFIVPNCNLAAVGTSPYLILLNSDTEVLPGWDEALVAHLQLDEDLAQVGYMGSKLDCNGKGGQVAFGKECDYICGWCFAISRETYRQFGLFDSKNLDFAYGEDSDLSLRLREAGKKIYALHLDLVIHHGNVTVNEVKKKNLESLKITFEKNHEYVRRRWKNFLPKVD